MKNTVHKHSTRVFPLLCGVRRGSEAAQGGEEGGAGALRQHLSESRTGRPLPAPTAGRRITAHDAYAFTLLAGRQSPASTQALQGYSPMSGA